MKRRTLKVSESEDWYKVHVHKNRSSKPLLRLQGKWLHDAGFPAGSRVVVRVENRRLTVVPARGK